MSDQPTDQDLAAKFRERLQEGAGRVTAVPDERDLADRIAAGDRRRRMTVVLAAASIVAVIAAATITLPGLGHQASPG